MTAVVPPSTQPPSTPTSAEPAPAHPDTFWEGHGQLTCAIIAGLFLLAATILNWTIGTAGHAGIAYHVLVGIAFVLGFYFGMQAALESIRERKLDINLLMVLGAVLAIFVGSAMEGALLLFLFTLAGALEHYAMQRTHAALESLTKLFPKEAVVLGDNDSQRKVPLDQLQIGDRVLVKPGENVAADGTVLEGTSAVDESAITGEFMPREKLKGAPVYAGTLNGSGRLVVQVAKPAKDTTLARIIHLVSQASEEKAPVERLFDKVGSAYTLAVLILSVSACLLMHYAFDLSWKVACYRAITLLIVASPCALIISTPVVILSAIATCARRGVILKGGRHLESLAALKALVFDKTGTLTKGQVQLTGLDILDLDDPAQSPDQHCAPQGTRRNLGTGETLHNKLLQIASSIESNSTHPLATAVVRAAKDRSLAPLPVEKFLQEAGQGIRGLVEGLPCVIGSPALVEGLCNTRTLQRLTDRISAAHANGETAVVLFYAGHAAVLRFSDTLRADAKATIAALHALQIRPLVMLTGDHRRVADAVANSLGLDEVKAELLPEDKLTAVSDLVHKHHAVGMIGDGINDAPALARATVGIAMGGIGSDAAMQAADVVLLSDAIDRLPWLITTARRARSVMIQNLTFAIAVILTLLVCTLLGWVPITLGVIGHEGSTLLVVANGLRLLLTKKDPS